MTKTENYNLPQWEAHDPVRRGDFNQAMANIDAEIAAAQEKGFVVGSYTGNGLTMDDGGQAITLGFRPRFLIIAKGWSTALASASMVIVSEYPNDGVENIVAFTDTGFTVANYTESSSSIKINQDGNSYGYVAFR